MELDSRAQSARRPRSADLMVQELIRQTSSGEFKPGQRIGSEQDLIQRFGLSRAVVREALRVLERDGIVSVKPGPNGGIFCRALSTQPLARSIGMYGAFHDMKRSDLVEARMELEVVTARLAAIRATSRDIDDLERLNDRWENTVGSRQFELAAEINVEFHVGLTRAAQNPVFAAFIEALGGLLYETAFIPDYPAARLDYVVHSHENVLKAIQDHDPDHAMDAMREHLETFRPMRPATGGDKLGMGER